MFPGHKALSLSKKQGKDTENGGKINSSPPSQTTERNGNHSLPLNSIAFSHLFPLQTTTLFQKTIIRHSHNKKLSHRAMLRPTA